MHRPRWRSHPRRAPHLTRKRAGLRAGAGAAGAILRAGARAGRTGPVGSAVALISVIPGAGIRVVVAIAWNTVPPVVRRVVMAVAEAQERVAVRVGVVRVRVGVVVVPVAVVSIT